MSTQYVLSPSAQSVHDFDTSEETLEYTNWCSKCGTKYDVRYFDDGCPKCKAHFFNVE